MSWLLSAKRCEFAELSDRVLRAASAFILVDYLATARPDAFRRYTRGLADGERLVDAWVKAFPDLAPGQDAGLAALDRAAAVHANQQHFRSLAFPVRVPTFEVPLERGAGAQPTVGVSRLTVRFGPANLAGLMSFVRSERRLLSRAGEVSRPG